ncbi:predicted protein [Nematostella vectensis]|uniref:Prolyl endopeptidase n=1 Tax=Nematostella vectensis TaxID=45351 RepID=A7T1N8_NEMVE|nr:predicted protein [Nematostella vectensis]|eukprot:XP_001622222.1 predicted protein [Nematostella vectensis]
MAAAGKICYPKVRRDSQHFDEYHGTKIAEPYIWLEDPDSDETKAFVKAQNDITLPYLAECEVREKFKDSVLYVQESLDGEAHVFLDPNKIKEDGTAALRGHTFSKDGTLFAYSLSLSGSDWVTIKFMKVEGEEELPDSLERAKFTSMSWTHDNKGLFYNKYPTNNSKADGTETDMNLDQKLYYHMLGTNQGEDVLCCEFPEHPKWHIGGEVSVCGRYLIITPREGCDPVNRLYYCDLQKLPHGITEKLPYVKVVDNFYAEYEYITNEGTVFTFKTNLNSPRYKLINIDLEKPEMENWQTLVDQDSVDVLEWASCVRNDLLVLGYLHDVKSVLHLHALTSGDHLVNLPLDIGSVVGFSGEKEDTEIFYQFTSFLTPGTIYHCDLSDQNRIQPKVFREIKVKDFDASLFETEQVFYESKDGTKIPMFLVHKKGITLDSSHPAYLYGYGGFNISITPSFSVSRIIYMQNLGGVVAIANIRGGGEYGEDWHQAGMLGNKQNVFDDFQAAANYLISHEYTEPKRLTICGGSNGGLLVCACANQAPELFGCIIAQVPVTDMLKFQKFTIGHAWTTDFGCSDKKEEFEWLIKYSPLHNIKVPDNGAQYPPLMLLTADHDDRVVPLHSFKFIAELQHVMGSQDNQAGHGHGKPTAKVIEECADTYAFVARSVGANWQD